MYQLPAEELVLEILLEYLSSDKVKGHRRTVDVCDRQAGNWKKITAEAVASTRSPYLNSRISNAERDWFVNTGSSAPLHLVGVLDSLAIADPVVDGGLYDRFLVLYEHFSSRKPPGVATAKIHKVLYVMRPNSFPILDSRLLRVLKGNAQVVAARIREERGSEDRGHLNYWAAIRELLNENAAIFRNVRQKLVEHDDPFIKDASQFLTELRLLDIVLWRAGQ